MSKARKLRRFFTAQSLQRQIPGDLWLEPAETHHLRDSIRLKPGDTCLVTDGEGREAEALIREFSKDGRTHLHILHLTAKTGTVPSGKFRLRVAPALLRKGKTDILVEKAQELGVAEFWPIFSEHCEIKIAKEKTGKTVDRWNRIAREASKQSGSLQVVQISDPRDFKEAITAIPLEEPLVIFHPSPNAISFAGWLETLQDFPDGAKTLSVFIGPEGGFSEAEIDWVHWHRKGKNFALVGLGEVLFKADTAFIGIVAALRFSGMV